MKVEITNEGEYYKIYKVGDLHPIKNLRSGYLSPFAFSDDDIENLIGEKAYSTSFQDGKYTYNVIESHLDLISGNRSAQNRVELAMYND